MEDSYKNWFQVRYQYDETDTIENAIETQRTVDLGVLEWGMNLPENEMWHVRYGLENNQSWFSIRVKPTPNQMDKRKQEAERLGDMIPATPIVDDYKWWKTDDAFPGVCKNIAEWISMAKILQNLSKITYELVKMNNERGELFLYHVAIHHLHNMMHIQDDFYPVPLDHSLQKRCLKMSGRLLTYGNETVQWIPSSIH